MLFRRFCLILFSAFTITAVAQDKKQKLEIGRVIYVSYGSPSWNLDSSKIDTASIILRDKNTGKIVQIQLEETEPDSAQFMGRFSVSLGDQGGIAPEIFIPPKELRGADKDNRKLFEMVQSGKLQRKPIIWKKNERGNGVVDVYDTRDQAEAALKAYDAEQKMAAEIKKKAQVSAEAAIAAAKAAERKAQMEKLALEAAKRESERVRLEQLERQRAIEREEQARKLSEAEKAARKAKAEQANNEAVELYGQGDYVRAETKFRQAVELDPENKDYYYKYGLTLYRNKKFNEALVALKLSTAPPDKELEKKYFMGLVHYRLAEFDPAAKFFEEVGSSNDDNLGPSSLFYAGIIYFNQEKFEASKKKFETVIDTSKDPSLDEQAEQYIDRIAAAMAFQKLRENKFTISFVMGLMYDSNVLLSPDTIPGGGKPTSTADMRLLTIADLQYRPIFTERQELTPHVTANLTNSSKTANASGDPFLYSIAAPYTFKNTKGGRYSFTPGYELLFMDPNSSGTKSNQMKSYYASVDTMMITTPNWISTYSFEYRNDKSLDPSSIGPNDLTSNKYTLRTTQMTFLDKNRKKILIPALSYAWNNAKGEYKSYLRYDIGLTYVQPAFWNTSWNIGLNFYNQKYTRSDPSTTQRADNDYTLTTGLTKPIREWVTWGLMGSYTKNGSNDTNYAYTKYLIMTTATFSTNF